MKGGCSKRPIQEGMQGDWKGWECNQRDESVIKKIEEMCCGNGSVWERGECLNKKSYSNKLT